LRIKKQETRLILHQHDDDDDDVNLRIIVIMLLLVLSPALSFVTLGLDVSLK